MMLTRSCQQPEQIVTEIVKTDTLTLVRIDTITQVLPEPYKVVVRDTIYINDNINGNINDNINGNIFVQEVKEYKDSTYYAKISGINAYLEEIRVYPRTEYKYINTTEIRREKPQKLGIGIQAGYGAGKNGIQPYVGVGIQYDLLRF
jgi:hypothetical protein